MYHTYESYRIIILLMLGVHDNYCIFSIHHSCIYMYYFLVQQPTRYCHYTRYVYCVSIHCIISQPMKLLHSYVYWYLHTTWHIESTHTTARYSVILSLYKFYSFLLHLYMHLHLHNTWHNNIIYTYRYTTDTLAFSLYINSTHFHTIFYSI